MCYYSKSGHFLPHFRMFQLVLKPRRFLKTHIRSHFLSSTVWVHGSETSNKISQRKYSLKKTSKRFQQMEILSLMFLCFSCCFSASIYVSESISVAECRPGHVNYIVLYLKQKKLQGSCQKRVQSIYKYNIF